jgi:hypothetical protein
MDFGYVNAYSDDEEIPLRKRKVVRQRENHFEKWDEGEFFQRFCLSTATVELRCPATLSNE